MVPHNRSHKILRIMAQLLYCMVAMQPVCSMIPAAALLYIFSYFVTKKRYYIHIFLDREASTLEQQLAEQEEQFAAQEQQPALQDQQLAAQE
jgi:hypothetical protein